MSPSTPFLWTPECQTAFDTLKWALSSDDMLLFPDFHKHFFLACDASDISIGCALMQKDESGTLRPIAYSGRSLKLAETRYTILDRELLAIVSDNSIYEFLTPFSDLPSPRLAAVTRAASRAVLTSPPAASQRAPSTQASTIPGPTSPRAPRRGRRS